MSVAFLRLAVLAPIAAAIGASPQVGARGLAAAPCAGLIDPGFDDRADRSVLPRHRIPRGKRGTVGRAGFCPSIEIEIQGQRGDIAC